MEIAELIITDFMNQLSVNMKKKKLWGLSFFVFATIVPPGQIYGQSYLDSLNGELVQVKADTSRVKILGAIAYYYSVNLFDSGISYANRTLDLARKINSKEGEFLANRALLFSYNSMANYNKVLEIAIANKAGSGNSSQPPPNVYGYCLY